jgi:hypothetical protein
VYKTENLKASSILNFLEGSQPAVWQHQPPVVIVLKVETKRMVVCKWVAVVVGNCKSVLVLGGFVHELTKSEQNNKNKF